MPRLRGGIRPSPFDGRYEQWMGQGTTKAQVELPRVPIKNQGSKVDCCTAMAVCTAMEMVDSSRNNYIPLSPLFNYYYSRVNPDKRLGAVPLSFALRSAMTIGVSSYALHPYQATVDNAEQNLVSNRLVTGEVGRVAIGQYDIVLANILAEPLCALAETLCQSTDVGGTLVLSGILQTQRDEVAAAYEGRAIVIDEYEQEGWVAMVLKTC